MPRKPPQTEEDTSSLIPPPPPPAVSASPGRSKSPQPGQCAAFPSHALARQDSAAPLLPRPTGDEHIGDSGAGHAQAGGRPRKDLPPVRVLRAWTYPLKGIYYLLRHPILWIPIRRRLPLALLISSLILAALFVLLFLPQAAFLALFHVPSPLAYLHAALAVLAQGATLISFVLETWVIEESVCDIFDATLLIKGEDELVARGRELREAAVEENGVRSAGAANVVERLGEWKKDPALPFSASCWAAFMLVIELPVNLLPIVGPWLFIALQGLTTGPQAHWHYFQLLGLRRRERNRWVKARRLEYLGFGFLSLLFQTFPIASTLACYTNAIGAALWAVQEERVKRGEGLDMAVERT